MPKSTKFRPCCYQALYSFYLQKLKNKKTNTYCKCTGCGKDFMPGPLAVQNRGFVVIHDDDYFVFYTDAKEAHIEFFFPRLGVYNKDPQELANNLVSEGLLSEKGAKLILNKYKSPQEYITEAIASGVNERMIQEDLAMVKKCHILWEPLKDNIAVDELKNKAIAMLRGHANAA